MHEICDMATLADGGRIRTRRIYNLQPELSLVQRQADRCVNIAIRDEPERLHLDGADLFGCLGEYALFLCAESVGLFSESCAGLLTGTPSFVEILWDESRLGPRARRSFSCAAVRSGPSSTRITPTPPLSPNATTVRARLAIPFLGERTRLPDLVHVRGIGSRSQRTFVR